MLITQPILLDSALELIKAITNKQKVEISLVFKMILVKY